MVRRHRTRRHRRGGMDTEAENKFLEKNAKERKRSYSGDLGPPKVIEAEGTGTKQAKPISSKQEHDMKRAREAAGLGGRRTRRRHTRRRR